MFCLISRPLDEQRLLGQKARFANIASSGAHPNSCKAACQMRVGSLAPTDVLPSTFGQAQRESLDAHRLTYAVCKREHVEKTTARSPYGIQQMRQSQPVMH